MIIAIAGPPRSGKTQLATSLARRLRSAQTVAVLHLDHCEIRGPDQPLDLGVFVKSQRRASRRRQLQDTYATADHPSADTNTDQAEILIVEGAEAGSYVERARIQILIWKEPALGGCMGHTSENLPATVGAVPVDTDIIVSCNDSGHEVERIVQALQYLPNGRPVCPGTLRPATMFERVDQLPDPARLFETLYGQSRNAVWLDSSLIGGADRGRYSIMADDGGAFGHSVSHRSNLTTMTAGCVQARSVGPFFQWLDGAWTSQGGGVYPEEYECEFVLGWLGYLGYELKRETGGNSVEGTKPDAGLIHAGRAIVLDHRTQTTWILAAEAADAIAWVTSAMTAIKDARWDPTIGEVPTTLPAPVFTCRDSETQYKGKIVQAQEHIANGDSYEVCLTTTLASTWAENEGTVDPFLIYTSLRNRNPTPFSSFMKFGSLAVASTSPERFLRIDAEGGMRAEPIKGTRPRSMHTAEDSRQRRDLRFSAKDRAENIMIVDLLRNDLSRFAVPGSVQVKRLCDVESYATVHQMVSTIDAQLLPGQSRARAISACFPAGSMTGAPKISTMAILEELEREPRGVYSGALGYFSTTGACDLAVAIRTLVISTDARGGTTFSMGVGGAITADSDVNDEYDEIRTKARGVLATLGSSFPRADAVSPVGIVSRS